MSFPAPNPPIGPITVLRQRFPVYLRLFPDRLPSDHRFAPTISNSLSISFVVIGGGCLLIGGAPITLWAYPGDSEALT